MGALDEQDVKHLEEMVQYLAAHDGRLPTDDMPLAWWLVETFDEPKDSPVRQHLASIPITKPGQGLTPKKAHAWATWLARRAQLDVIHRRGLTLDDALAKDSELRRWADLNLSRYHTGQLGAMERLLLDRTPAWSFDRQLTTKAASKETAFKVGLNAVRDFYTEHGHADIPEGTMVGDLDLHAWWKYQRNCYALGNLKPHVLQRLEKLGKLGADLRSDKERAKEEAAFRHRKRLEEVASYVAKHGMEMLSKDQSTVARGAQTWIGQYHKGTLDPALVEALEGIEGWSWEAADLEELRAFALVHGHVDVPRDYAGADGLDEEVTTVHLEAWNGPHPSGAVKRRARRADRIAHLGWERAMQELRDWHRAHGRPPGKGQVTGSGFRLGGFLLWAEESAGGALLARVRLRELAEVTGSDRWLKAEPQPFGQAVKTLERFAGTQRHCHPLWGGLYGAGVDLSRFLKRLDADRAHDDLSAAEMRRLERLPGWSWSRRERAETRKVVERAGAARKKVPPREPTRSVRTDVADPSSQLNKSGLRQFLPDA